jgi:hypothetical protein
MKRICLSACLIGLFVFAPAVPQDDPPKLQDLNEVLRELRELRAGYYRRKRARQAKIDATRAEIASLRKELAGLGEETDKIDKDLAAARAEVRDLESRKSDHGIRLTKIRSSIPPFVEAARKHIREGPPCRIDSRLKALAAIGPDGRIAESLGGLWVAFQDEVRMARSGETYTDEVKLPDGRRKHARMLRVGKHVLAFVTEDGLETGLWIRGEGWVTDPARIRPDAIRAAIEILDRRRAPEWVPLPVPIGGGQ